MDSRFTVDIANEEITIFYDDREFLHWVDDEWKEDSTVTVSIANAIYLSQRHPEKLLKMFPEKI